MANDKDTVVILGKLGKLGELEEIVNLQEQKLSNMPPRQEDSPTEREIELSIITDPSKPIVNVISAPEVVEEGFVDRIQQELIEHGYMVIRIDMGEIAKQAMQKSKTYGYYDLNKLLLERIIEKARSISLAEQITYTDDEEVEAQVVLQIPSNSTRFYNRDVCFLYENTEAVIDQFGQDESDFWDWVHKYLTNPLLLGGSTYDPKKSQYHVKQVFTGRNPLYYLNHPELRKGNRVTIIEVDNSDHRDFIRAVRNEITPIDDPNEKLINCLYELSNGHAGLTQKLVSYVKKNNIRAENLGGNLAGLVNAANEYIEEHLLSGLQDNERKAVLALSVLDFVDTEGHMARNFVVSTLFPKKDERDMDIHSNRVVKNLRREGYILSDRYQLRQGVRGIIQGYFQRNNPQAFREAIKLAVETCYVTANGFQNIAKLKTYYEKMTKHYESILNRIRKTEDP